MTAYMGKKVTASAGVKSKQPFCTTQESTQKHPVATAKSRKMDEVLPSPLHVTTLLLG